MANVTITVDAKEVEAILDHAIRASSNLTPTWKKIDKRLHVFFRKQFETSGARAGARWKPLLLRTQRARVRPGGNRGGVNRPLWDHARLKKSMQAPGPESVRVFRPLSYERGTQVPYSRFHQEGDGVPERAFIPDPFPGYMVRSWLRLVEGQILDVNVVPSPGE